MNKVQLMNSLFCMSLAFLLALLSPAEAVAYNRIVTVSTEDQYNDHKNRQSQILENCKRREGYLALASQLTLVLTNHNGSEKKREVISAWRCEKSAQVKREEERRREEGQRTKEFRIARDPTTECDRAILYGEHDGEGCREAEAAVKSVAERGEAVQALSGLGAAVVQATTAVQASNIDSQDAAFDVQEQAVIAGIIGAGIDVGNSVWGAAQLSRAESDANRAASGIKSAQATYIDAENAAVSDNRGYAQRLEKGGSLQQVETQIHGDYDKRIAAIQTKRHSQLEILHSTGDPSGQLALTVSSMDSEIASLKADRDKEIQAAHKAFASGINGSGIEETVRNNFGTFDNFRKNASKGIRESNAIAEQAAAASMNAKFRAVTGGIALATQVGQLQAIRRARANLQGIEPEAPPAPVIRMSGNPVTPTIPDIPPSTPRESEISDFALEPLGDGVDPARVEGTLGGGAKFAKGKFKPRKTQVSGTYGGGITDGNGSGASRTPPSKRSSGPRSVDYAGGGAGLPSGAGSIAGPASDTDFQNVIRSLLGKEKEDNAEGGAKFDYYRKVASSRGKGGDNKENSDPRSIFERVKIKYNDVVLRGVI